MKRTALAVAVIIALLAGGVAAYKVYETHTARARVLALLKDGNERLRGALSAQASGKSANEIEASVAATESHVSSLRTMKTSSFTPLADAADDALVTSREIMRRQLEIERGRTRLRASFDALAKHIKTDRGANDWTREAVRLKNAVDSDLRAYRIAVQSYATLLDSLPASQARIAPYLQPALLVDEKLAQDARQQALDAYDGYDREIKRVSTLQAYRLSGR